MMMRMKAPPARPAMAAGLMGSWGDVRVRGSAEEMGIMPLAREGLGVGVGLALRIVGCAGVVVLRGVVREKVGVGAGRDDEGGAAGGGRALWREMGRLPVLPNLSGMACRLWRLMWCVNLIGAAHVDLEREKIVRVM